MQQDTIKDQSYTMSINRKARFERTSKSNKLSKSRSSKENYSPIPENYIKKQSSSKEIQPISHKDIKKIRQKLCRISGQNSMKQITQIKKYDSYESVNKIEQKLIKTVQKNLQTSPSKVQILGNKQNRRIIQSVSNIQAENLFLKKQFKQLIDQNQLLRKENQNLKLKIQQLENANKSCTHCQKNINLINKLEGQILHVRAQQKENYHLKLQVLEENLRVVQKQLFQMKQTQLPPNKIPFQVAQPSINQKSLNINHEVKIQSITRNDQTYKIFQIKINKKQ